MLRSSPWHLRKLTTEHEQWFRNLSDLHALTVSWLKELHPQTDPQESFKLKRVQTPGLGQMLDRLEIFTREQIQPGLEELIEAKTPEELLREIEKIVYSIQSWTLKNILEKTQESELEALANLLERSSFEAGRQSCAKRWKGLPENHLGDLRSILTLSRDSPFAGFPHLDAFLVQRATASELRLELLHCPHQSPFWEVREIADDLCTLQSHWIRGFAYELNSRVLIENELAHDGRRCFQRWSFLYDQSSGVLTDHLYSLL